MISREYIYQRVKSQHVVAVHMKGEERMDNLSLVIYVIHDLLLEEWEEKQILKNIKNGIDTSGKLKVKASRTSDIYTSLEDSQIKEYDIDTNNITEVSYR